MADLMTGTGRKFGLSASFALALFITPLSSFAQDAKPAATEKDEASTGSSEETPAGAQTAEGEAAAAAALETARLHFTNGVELISESPANYQDAFPQFKLALEKSGGSWKVLGNLGLCALKLERDGEALEYYREYLEKGGDEVDAGERKHIERELLLIEGNMTTVTLESSEPGARITVKREGSNAPSQFYELTDGKTELGLRAGSLTITARSGDTSRTWNANLAAGDAPSHVFDFSATPEPTLAPAPVAAVSDAPPSSRGPNGVRLAGYITTGIGVATLGGGLITGLMSQSKRNKAEEQCKNEICPEDIEKDFDSASSLATVANILYISGGVIAASGITLVILGDNKTSEVARRHRTGLATLNLTPLPTVGGGGLFQGKRTIRQVGLCRRCRFVHTLSDQSFTSGSLTLSMMTTAGFARTYEA